MSTDINQQQQQALAHLQQRIRECRRCVIQGYLPDAHPIVSGHITDRIMVIGQAPGHRSVAHDQPFSGPGGAILQHWLEAAGFPPGYLHEHTYLSSLTRCDPGKNASGHGDRKPGPAEIALCRPYLEAELRLVRPKVILLVGAMAIEAFYGPVKLSQVIGTYQQQGEHLCLPLPHPSGVSRWLNNEENKKLHQQALALLARWRNLYNL